MHENEETQNLKLTKFNRQQERKINERSIIKKTKKAGSLLAKRGGILPSNEKLESKYNYNTTLIETFKRAYLSNYNTPEEQGLRRAINAAKECIWKGRKLPSDKKLGQKYKPNEILAYKKVFLANYTTKEKQQSRKEKNQFCVKKYHLNKKRIKNEQSSPTHNEPKEFFIKTFVARLEKELQKSAKFHEQICNNIDEHELDIGIRSAENYSTIESRPLSNFQEINDLIPSPFDVLNKNHTTTKKNKNKNKAKDENEFSKSLLFQYPFEKEYMPYTEEEYSPTIEELNWISYSLI